MASFLARALKLTGTAPDAFTDDEASIHEPNINLVAKAGIATGCAADQVLPTALVSREQMASFLARALKLAGTAPDAFTDDEQSIHEPNINLVAKARRGHRLRGRQVLPHRQRHPGPDGRLPPPGLRAVGGEGAATLAGPSCRTAEPPLRQRRGRRHCGTTAREGQAHEQHAPVQSPRVSSAGPLPGGRRWLRWRSRCCAAWWMPSGTDLSSTARADTPTGEHSCVVLSDGTVRCWGWNWRGQLGDGTTSDSATPVAAEGITTATAVATGGRHSCALLSGGSMKCWGDNFSGELGDGTTTNSPSPVAVSGITTAIAVAAGGAHTCALLAGGSVKCWGWNADGELGNGTTTDSSLPVAVPGISTATAISAGYWTTCAVLSGGGVKCWGSNIFGQLGDGTTADSLSPVTVSGIATAFTVAAGWQHTCALLAGGSMRCWGDNEFGQLGDGTTTQRLSPAPVSGIATATAITAGAFHSCARLSSGQVKCWGSNLHGGLGDGTTDDRLLPVAVSGIATATAVAAGEWHTCATVPDDGAMCWGSNSTGQLGDGTTTERHTPVAVALATGPPPSPTSQAPPSSPTSSGSTPRASPAAAPPPTYCPDGYVTREQMATFLARALKLTGTAPDAFTDDEASPHEPNINLVAKAGIATGCAATKYCPTALVSREQMASFLARALKLAGTAPDAFTDDEQSIHEPNINLVAKAGVATGCGNGKYCPTANVTRGQMAAFLHRAFGP